MTRLAPLCLAATLLAALPALSQAAPSAAMAAQQQKMKDCNAEAKTKALKGDERKTFMKTCLSKAGTPAGTPAAGTVPVATTAAMAAKMPAPMSGPAPAVSPASRMKTCNAEAGTKNLKGDARKSFMATCLKA